RGVLHQERSRVRSHHEDDQVRARVVLGEVAVDGAPREPLKERAMPTTSAEHLTDAILARDQFRTTDLFFRTVRREGRSTGEPLGEVTPAGAPFVQVPSHIDVRDGQITLITDRIAARRNQTV